MRAQYASCTTAKVRWPRHVRERVHEAVLAAKDRETGVSVHLVDGEYDNGRVIAQCRVAVLPDDSVEELTKRVQTSEKELIVATILRIARERQAG